MRAKKPPMPMWPPWRRRKTGRLEKETAWKGYEIWFTSNQENWYMTKRMEVSEEEALAEMARLRDLYPAVNAWRLMRYEETYRRLPLWK